MFHVTNFGGLGGRLRAFTDAAGFVPEAGDRHQDMCWDAATDWADEQWDEFVAGAVKATDAANEAVIQWRAEGSGEGDDADV